MCWLRDYIQSPEEVAGENKNDLQYVNMDGLRRNLPISGQHRLKILILKIVLFDVPDKMYEAKLLQAGDLLQKRKSNF